MLHANIYLPSVFSLLFKCLCFFNNTKDLFERHWSVKATCVERYTAVRSVPTCRLSFVPAGLTRTPDCDRSDRSADPADPDPANKAPEPLTRRPSGPPIADRLL